MKSTLALRITRIAAVGLALWIRPSIARAADEPQHREMSQTEIETWLESEDKARPEEADEGVDDEEVPPLPPRHHGLVVESSVGAIGHLGPLRRVSPTSPWFHLQAGYELLKFLMVFGEGDVIFSTTRYANPPPEPRGYALYGGGGGLRLTVKPHDRIGLYLQGSAGFARVNDDTLYIYGYRNADKWGLYYGGELGFEWYQVNPHYAFSLHGGARNYEAVLGRDRTGEKALAWVGGASLRYVF
jgi:hypothetical protein